MGLVLPGRAAYRVRQFARAIIASLTSLSPAELAQVWAILPKDAWPLFAAMPRQDQHHCLGVMRSLAAASFSEPALMQAALLHDCAKRAGGIALWHRVFIVLLRAFWPAWMARWVDRPMPARGSWHYPFWAHANHPLHGARSVAATGCDALAVWLIRNHQDPAGQAAPFPGSPTAAASLLAALQVADDGH